MESESGKGTYVNGTHCRHGSGGGGGGGGDLTESTQRGSYDAGHGAVVEFRSGRRRKSTP
jgi:hypothetical protein